MATINPRRGPLPFIHPNDMPEVYAAPGTGDCLVPLVPANAKLAFDKREAVRPGDVVVAWFPPEGARRFCMPGWVKRLASPLPPEGRVGVIELEMINPQRTFSIRSTDVLAVHKCIGEADTVIASSRALPRSNQTLCEPAAAATDADCRPVIALEMFAKPPCRTIVHAATDEGNAPLIRSGEIVVVDHDGTPGWLPVEGGLFLVDRADQPADQGEWRIRLLGRPL